MLRFISIFILVFTTLTVSAHQLRPSKVDIEFQPNGTFELQIETNLEARIAGISPNHSDTEDSPQATEYNRLRQLSPNQLRKEADKYELSFRKGLHLNFDSATTELAFIDYKLQPVGDTRLARKSVIIYQGDIPSSAQQVNWSFESSFGSSIVHFKIKGDENKASHWLKPGLSSPLFKLDERVKPKTTGEIAYEYTILGFEHIIPKGLDHILFVLGLFLLSLAWRPLLWQVTAFTLAHTITLALTILGYISLSPVIIEPLIALSIAYVGIENLLTRKLHSWRPIIVFVFGLLHGMGFASVLTDLGLPENSLATALITFNVGVELGQLAVILIAFILTLPLHKNPDIYRKLVVIPGSLIIALMGLYWTWERIWG